MSGSSPAHSSLSTTAFAGERNGGSNGAALSTDDFYFPSDLISIQDRKDEAMIGLSKITLSFCNCTCILCFSQIFFASFLIWFSHSYFLFAIMDNWVLDILV